MREHTRILGSRIILDPSALGPVLLNRHDRLILRHETFKLNAHIGGYSKNRVFFLIPFEPSFSSAQKASTRSARGLSSQLNLAKSCFSSFNYTSQRIFEQSTRLKMRKSLFTPSLAGYLFFEQMRKGPFYRPQRTLFLTRPRKIAC